MYKNPLKGSTITKHINRVNTLRLLFANKLISRTKLASFLGISTAAITAIVNEFIENGLLNQNDDPIASSHKKAGRKQLPLSINYDWKYIVAIDLHPDGIHIAATNLAGEILCEDYFAFSVEYSAKEFCIELAKECIRMLWSHSIQLNQILGAGVTVIGPVDHVQGIALHPFRLFDEAVPLVEYLQSELPFPITVESNVCALLRSELLYRENIGNAQNILMLKWGPGVGSATAISGQIYKGYQFQSSEIGHSYLSKEKGKRCSCGRNGCLETVISEECIINYIAGLIENGKHEELRVLKEGIGTPTSENLKKYLDYSDKDISKYINSCASSLADATNNAISILAPEKLILIGSLFECDTAVKVFIDYLQDLNPHLPDNFCVQSSFRNQKTYIGATAIAIESFLLI